MVAGHILKILWQRLRAWWNLTTGRNWPAGRTLDTRALNDCIRFKTLVLIFIAVNRIRISRRQKTYYDTRLRHNPGNLCVWTILQRSAVNWLPTGRGLTWYKDECTGMTSWGSHIRSVTYFGMIFWLNKSFIIIPHLVAQHTRSFLTWTRTAIVKRMQFCWFPWGNTAIPRFSRAGRSAWPPECFQNYVMGQMSHVYMLMCFWFPVFIRALCRL